MSSAPFDVQRPATEIQISEAIRVSDPDTEDTIRRLAFERDRLQAENQRLQAIVDRLPKTADGVPIVNEMTVWTWSRGETPKPAPIRQKRLLYCWGDWCDVQTGYVAATRNSVPLCCVYSTREAAEKASVEK